LGTKKRLSVAAIAILLVGLASGYIVGCVPRLRALAAARRTLNPGSA